MMGLNEKGPIRKGDSPLRDHLSPNRAFFPTFALSYPPQKPPQKKCRVDFGGITPVK